MKDKPIIIWASIEIPVRFTRAIGGNNKPVSDEDKKFMKESYERLKALGLLK